jgi:hypothetical protein
MKRVSQWTCGLALVLCASTASADPILADGSWHEFLFGVAVSPASACGGGCTPTTNPVADQSSDSPWTFSGPGTLTVLDLFQKGDRFEAFDFGISLGTTSVVANTGVSSCGGDISCALADAGYSRGVINLGAGAHSLTLNVIQNAVNTGGGAAAFQLASVPEPGLLLLFGAGLAAARMRGRRRAHR